MITAVYTFEGVNDPGEATRGLKRILKDLAFTETVHGVEALAASGAKILVPWSNVAFLMLENEKPAVNPEPPPVVPIPTAKVDTILPPKPSFEVKRGPGRPRKDG
jgi:hypothetical protein